MNVGNTGVGTYVYPWDVVGDPACADRIAGLGVDRAILAAAYHTVRAISPLHPSRKIVTANHSAVYYQPDRARWRGRAVQPAVAAWAPGSFHEAAHALQGAGLGVYAWAVLTHNQHLGTLHPELAVVNAFGDHYPWALCAANESVREYCVTLAAEIAGLPEIAGLELESCGWYGFEHLHAHDKTGASALCADAKNLLSLCFCDACETEYADAGLDPRWLRDYLRTVLEPILAGIGDTASTSRDPKQHAMMVEQLTGLAGVRVKAANRLREDVIAAAHDARKDLPVLMHTHLDPSRTGANPGTNPEDLFAQSVGAVYQCWGPFEEGVSTLSKVSALASQAHDGAPIVASLLAVANLGGHPADLADAATALRAAGAHELRFYHAGLATSSDLQAMRAATEAWAKR